jgi:hypothetical protein
MLVVPGTLSQISVSADRRTAQPDPENEHMTQGPGISAEHRRDDTWRALGRTEYDLATAISDRISEAGSSIADCVQSLRASPALIMLSDYVGVHKDARFEVMSFLVTTPSGSTFWAERQRVRQGQMGPERRMSYKALGDKVRLKCLPAYLDVADRVTGLLISFCIDKNAANRLSEEYRSETAFGKLAPWAPRAFRKLTTIGHLAGIVVQGLRGDGQDLIWITDEDEIAPNPDKHAETTLIFSHLLSSYCTGPMGHFRFGTTASDPGDLHIEDLASVPDLAAGCLNELLTYMYPHPESRSVDRLFVPAGGRTPAKVRLVAAWLAGSASPLTKLNVVLDESAGLCSSDASPSSRAWRNSKSWSHFVSGHVIPQF